MRTTRRAAFTALSLVLLGPGICPAVYLNPDGLGQALIYPYYTVRSAGNNPFNTYVSVTNADTLGKAIRVRVREGGNGRQVASFNLYLSPGDMWTAAVVPTENGASLITADRSCTEPAFNPAGMVGELELSNAAFNGANGDGGDTTPDRTREGYIEMIEMASITPGSATANAISQMAGQGPANCATLRAATSPAAADSGPPRGKLRGTLTLINVASGLDSTLTATALAALTTQAFFRPASDSYPDWDSVEVTPASVIEAGGTRHRLAWSRGVDAVSSVLMQAKTGNEYVLDTSAGSLTDWVFTMPTRRFYRSGATLTGPFADSGSAGCVLVDTRAFDREARGGPYSNPCADLGCGGAPVPLLCHASTVWPIMNGAAHAAPLFNSKNAVLTPFHIPGNISFENGRGEARYVPGFSIPALPAPSLVSQATSTSTDLRTGAVTTAAFRVIGLPVVGFMARSFSNGSLTCATGVCQGNYGSAFTHRATRQVEVAP